MLMFTQFHFQIQFRSNMKALILLIAFTSLAAINPPISYRAIMVRDSIRDSSLIIGGPVWATTGGKLIIGSLDSLHIPDSLGNKKFNTTKSDSGYYTGNVIIQKDGSVKIGSTGVVGKLTVDGGTTLDAGYFTVTKTSAGYHKAIDVNSSGIAPNGTNVGIWSFASGAAYNCSFYGQSGILYNYGHVGIGPGGPLSSFPSCALDVSGKIKGDTVTAKTLNADSAHFTGGTVVQKDGHIGIGTATATSPIHISKYHLDATSSFRFDDTYAPISYGVIENTANGWGQTLWSWQPDNSNNGPNIAFSTGQGSSVLPNSNIRMLIDKTGNIGMGGNVSPSCALDVTGAGKFSTNLTVDTTNSRAMRINGLGAGVVHSSANGTLTSSTISASDIPDSLGNKKFNTVKFDSLFGTGNFTIQRNGILDLGTDVTFAKINVDGATKNAGYFVTTATSASPHYTLQAYCNGTTSTNGTNTAILASAGGATKNYSFYGDAGVLFNSGYVGIGSGNSSPSCALDVTGAGKFSLSLAVGSAPDTGCALTISMGGSRKIALDTMEDYDTTTGYINTIHIYNASGVNYVKYHVNRIRVRIDGDTGYESWFIPVLSYYS